MYLFIDEWSARLKNEHRSITKHPWNLFLFNSKKCNTFSSPQAIKKCEFKHHKVRQHDTWRRFWQRRDCWCRMNWYFIVIILLLTRKLYLCLHLINNNTSLNHFNYQDATALSLLMKRMMISQNFSAFKSVFRIKIYLVCI